MENTFRLSGKHASPFTSVSAVKWTHLCALLILTVSTIVMGILDPQGSAVWIAGMYGLHDRYMCEMD